MTNKLDNVKNLKTCLAYAHTYGFDDLYLYLTAGFTDVEVAIIFKDGLIFQYVSDELFHTEQEKESAILNVLDLINSEDCTSDRLWFVKP